MAQKSCRVVSRKKQLASLIPQKHAFVVRRTNEGVSSGLWELFRSPPAAVTSLMNALGCVKDHRALVFEPSHPFSVAQNALH